MILSRFRGSVTNNNGFWIRWLDLLTPSFKITLNYNQLQSIYCRGLAPLSSSCLNSLTTSELNYWTKVTQRQVKVKILLWPTVSRPVCLGTKHPFVAYDQILIIVWQLRVCWFGAPSLTRGLVCRLQLLLALASAVIFWSESGRTRGHILLSQIRDFPFRLLLRLTGSRWRYSTPHPHGSVLIVLV
jgi:hypothetical protein